ncbi:limonene-1,2-epoxide hydrolase family protein [Rhizobium lentis]|uniref:SnoaL-like domain-containing protein n=1 Tax=Rhizobium lentis TaxID=1138194 RepID=A0ABS7IS05_9HYPH|nr:limonene-1,2-epoxide hydrolase family protein [Rhizobium lentis]MBX5012725.1 SnoaL-like domain-containing protein [Rhizobium lentis]MBX5042570.1 SnoaL-like domain-containing protein [Rhizobium lentis]MBX5051096.1 SnoaL-like domain-containing protein [Rhizobium lentis]MBX5072404.1 SnoaL-like domain-containing protein [Rhizobium lentis]MBX5084220.1 SnoaL-like domain-containing protein [Rhizobium lentis]
MSTDPIKTALTFFGHWNTGHIDEAITMLSEEVLYDNVPFPNIVGRENVRKFHRDFGIGTTFTVDWTVTQIAAAGNVVLNERLDVFLHEGGGKIILPVMGTLTVVEGAITVWRDYFDPSDFDRQLALIGK